MTAGVHLRAGSVQPVWAGHPWVFAQAIERLSGAPQAGDEVLLYDPRGNALGRGYYSPGSALPVRLLTRDPEEALDGAFFRRRLTAALALRRALGLPRADTTGYRAVNAEGDGLAGLVVDVYGAVACVQFLTAGMKAREELVLDAVSEVTGATAVVEVPSGPAQRPEGIVSPGGLRRGAAEGLVFLENGVPWALGLPGTDEGGQKTGYYFDQRDNRARVASLARGGRVLDAFSYVGGFGLTAALGGAREVLCVDSGARAVEVGQRRVEALELTDRVRFTRGDVFKVLEALDREDRYDVVVLDPPKLARSAREVPRALERYRATVGAGARRVASGGWLVACSCSGSVDAVAFQRAVASGLRDAGREGSLVSLSGAGGDHPVPVAFPEAAYLKCATVRVW
ncbi:MAG: class I SAM-dependent rRNA methyltransferase [Deltaproteobacteria bacterium]|nr:class I SAM-dependent rRNA methyltransferase [Deltaproteobacteria bacterium]